MTEFIGTGQIIAGLRHRTAKNHYLPRLAAGIYLNTDPDDPTGRIEVAFKAILEAALAEAKIRASHKRGALPKGMPSSVLQQALASEWIDRNEFALLEKAEQAKMKAIAIDDFAPDQLTGGT